MQNRLCFSTLGSPDWTFEETVQNAARMGFAAIEVRGIGDELQTAKLPCFLPENRERTQALLDQHQIKICGIGTSAAFHDASAHAAALAEGEDALTIANALGIPGVRVFGDHFPEGMAREDVTRNVIEGLLKLCEYAERTGKARVLLEIHGDFITVEAVKPLIDAVGAHPSFGIVWDIEHNFRVKGNDFMPFYETIRPYVRHVHVKDCHIDAEGLHIRLPGEGDIDIGGMVRVLERDGYAGYYSFEWEKRWVPEIAGPEIAYPRYIAYMRSIG